MTRDDLKELGLEKSAIDRVMDLYGQSVNSIKSDLLAQQGAVKSKDDKIAELERKYADYGDLKAFKGKFEELSAKYDKDVKDLQSKVTKSELDAFVTDKLYKSRVINPSIVKSSDRITQLFAAYNGNKEQFGKEVDEVIEALRASDGYLFESKPSASQVGLDMPPTSQPSDPVVTAFYKRNPDLKK